MSDAKHQMILSLSKELYNKLATEAFDKNTTRMAIIREALKRYLEDNKITKTAIIREALKRYLEELDKHG